MRVILFALMFFISQASEACGLLKNLCLDQSTLSYDVRVNTSCSRNRMVLHGMGPGDSDFKELEVFSGNGTLNRTIDLGVAGNWMFYLECYDSCANTGAIGDTLVGDNRPPEGVRIDSVSVRGDSVIIGWSESVSKDLESYIVYFDEANGLAATLDTVRGELIYTEKSDKVNALRGSVSYRLGARDSCGFSTGPRVPHSTIFMGVQEIDFCDRVVILNRTDYGGWIKDSVKYYVVYREVGEGTWKRLATFSDPTVTLQLDTLPIDIEVKVRATYDVFGFSSSSNSATLLLSDERSLDTLYITGVDNYEDSVILKLRSSATELVDYFQLEFTNDLNLDWVEGRRIQSDGTGSVRVVLNGLDGGMYIRVGAISDCGEDLGYSNTGRVVDLTLTGLFEGLKGSSLNSALEASRVLTWTDYTEWESGHEYVIQRKLSLGWEDIEVTRDELYNDVFVPEVGVDSGFCYRVLARELVAKIEGDTGWSVSNEVCVFFDFHQDLPNAYIPSENGEKLFGVPFEGVNENASYIKVFNRWGQLVYDGGLEWNGGVMNDLSKPCESGVYFYTMRVELNDSRFYFVSRSLNVIR